MAEVALHRLFGLNLASDHPFESRLGVGAPPPDLAFTCRPAPPDAAAFDPGAPSFASPDLTPGGESAFTVHRLPTTDLLRYPGLADFRLGPRRIDCDLASPELAYLAEVRLLGTVLAFWLERSGLPVLHAAAVAVGDGAAVFLAGNRGGKSSLAANLMAAGHPLLTDDLLAVEPAAGRGFLGRPSYPQMRLWPDQAERFPGPGRRFPLAHPGYSKLRVPVGEGGLGTLAGGPRPLAALYLPERRPRVREPRLEPVAPREALVELLRRSFLPRLVQAVGWSARRFAALSELAEAVPCRRLVLPDDPDRLPAAARAVEADLDALAPARGLRGAVPADRWRTMGG